MRQICSLALLLSVLLGLAAPVAAQTRAPSSLQGQISDSSGAAVPGVTVTLIPVQAGAVRTTISDARGIYQFDGLPAGDYVIDARLPGFGGASSAVLIEAGEPVVSDLTLRLTPLNEVVTVTRSVEDLSAVPTAVAVIEGADIQAFQRRASPAEAFGGIPGFFVENRRNFSLSGGVQLAIRTPMPRFGLRGIQVVQDGVPLTMADGTTEPGNIDLGSVGRVEILRGPSSVLYGNSAGGVISVRSEFPSSGALVVEPDIQFGSYGYQQQAVKVGGSSGRISYLFNFSHLEVDGFRTHSAAEVNRANMVVRAALSPNTTLQGVFNLYDLPFGESAATITLDAARNDPTSIRPQAITQGWGESTTQGQGGVTLEHRIAEGHVVRATGWSLTRDVFNPIPFAIVELHRNASGFRSEYEGAGRLGTIPVTWTTGIDISSQGDDRLESENDGVPVTGGMARPGAAVIDQREEVLSVGPFAQVRAAVGADWMVTGGLRYDRYAFDATDHFLADGDQSGGRTLDAVSPMVGVTYAVSDQLNVYGSYATAYQTPTTSELSNRPTGGGGFNDELEPEQLGTFEVGIRGAIDQWQLRFETGVYASRLENAFVQFARPDEAVFFRNAGKASRNGLEALLEWKPTPRVSTRLAYTYQDFTLTDFVAPEGDFSGNQEPGVPPHQFFAAVRYDAPFGLHSALELRSLDSFPVNTTNTISNWAYQVVNGRIGFDRRWNGVAVQPFFGIDNLFNERYNGSTIVNSLGNRYFEPSPGREFYVGLRIGAGLF